jgi:hypothetical protein
MVGLAACFKRQDNAAGGNDRRELRMVEVYNVPSAAEVAAHAARLQQRYTVDRTVELARSRMAAGVSLTDLLTTAPNQAAAALGTAAVGRPLASSSPPPESAAAVMPAHSSTKSTNSTSGPTLPSAGVVDFTHLGGVAPKSMLAAAAWPRAPVASLGVVVDRVPRLLELWADPSTAASGPAWTRLVHLAAARFCRRFKIDSSDDCARLVPALGSARDGNVAEAGDRASAEAKAAAVTAEALGPGASFDPLDARCALGLPSGCTPPLVTLVSPHPGSSVGAEGVALRLRLAKGRTSPARPAASAAAAFCCLFLDDAAESAWCGGVPPGGDDFEVSQH